MEKRLSKPTSEVNDRDEGQGTTGAQPTTNEVKTKGHIILLYTQGLGESIKMICSRYAIQAHFKDYSTMKTYWSSPSTRTPWLTKVGPSIGFNVGTLHVMMNM